MGNELSTEDKARIQYTARTNYRKGDECIFQRGAFFAGAEYATRYERMANETLFEKLEAERAELKAENERLFKAFHDSEIKVDLLQAEIKKLTLKK